MSYYLIGFRIRKKMEEQDLSVTDLAKMTRLSSSYISRLINNGDYKEYNDNPTGYNLEKLSKALNCSVDWLLGLPPRLHDYQVGEVYLKEEEEYSLTETDLELEAEKLLLIAFRQLDAKERMDLIEDLSKRLEKHYQ